MGNPWSGYGVDIMPAHVTVIVCFTIGAVLGGIYGYRSKSLSGGLGLALLVSIIALLVAEILTGGLWALIQAIGFILLIATAIVFILGV